MFKTFWERKSSYLSCMTTTRLAEQNLTHQSFDKTTPLTRHPDQVLESRWDFIIKILLSPLYPSLILFSFQWVNVSLPKSVTHFQEQYNALSIIGLLTNTQAVFHIVEFLHCNSSVRKQLVMQCLLISTFQRKKSRNI